MTSNIIWNRLNNARNLINKASLCRGEERQLSESEVGELNGHLEDLQAAAREVTVLVSRAQNRFRVERFVKRGGAENLLRILREMEACNNLPAGTYEQENLPDTPSDLLPDLERQAALFVTAEDVETLVVGEFEEAEALVRIRGAEQLHRYLNYVFDDEPIVNLEGTV